MVFSYEVKISINRTWGSKFVFSLISCLQENIRDSCIWTGASPRTSTCVLSIYNGWKFARAFYWLYNKEGKKKNSNIIKSRCWNSVRLIQLLRIQYLQLLNDTAKSNKARNQHQEYISKHNTLLKLHTFWCYKEEIKYMYWNLIHF